MSIYTPILANSLKQQAIDNPLHGLIQTVITPAMLRIVSVKVSGELCALCFEVC